MPKWNKGDQIWLIHEKILKTKPISKPQPCVSWPPFPFLNVSTSSSIIWHCLMSKRDFTKFSMYQYYRSTSPILSCNRIQNPHSTRRLNRQEKVGRVDHTLILTLMQNPQIPDQLASGYSQDQILNILEIWEFCFPDGLSRHHSARRETWEGQVVSQVVF